MFIFNCVKAAQPNFAKVLSYTTFVTPGLFLRPRNRRILRFTCQEATVCGPGSDISTVVPSEPRASS